MMTKEFKDWFVKQFPAYKAMYNFLENHGSAQSYSECWESALRSIKTPKQSDCDGCGNPLDEANHVVICSDFYNLIGG